MAKQLGAGILVAHASEILTALSAQQGKGYSLMSKGLWSAEVFASARACSKETLRKKVNSLLTGNAGN